MTSSELVIIVTSVGTQGGLASPPGGQSYALAEGGGALTTTVRYVFNNSVKNNNAYLKRGLIFFHENAFIYVPRFYLYLIRGVPFGLRKLRGKSNIGAPSPI